AQPFTRRSPAPTQRIAFGQVEACLAGLQRIRVSIKQRAKIETYGVVITIFALVQGAQEQSWGGQRRRQRGGQRHLRARSGSRDRRGCNFIRRRHWYSNHIT